MHRSYLKPSNYEYFRGKVSGPRAAAHCETLPSQASGPGRTWRKRGLMPQAFVTGAPGFIGQALVSRFLGEGHSVRVQVGRRPSAARVSALGAQPVPGKLPGPVKWREGMTGGPTALLTCLAEKEEVRFDADRDVR
jgi:hypothetical protein